MKTTYFWMVLAAASGSPLAAQTVPAVEITGIELGEVTIGDNVFRASLTNLRDTALDAVLDLRAEPGMWLLPNWQRQLGFRLAPHETRTIEAPYRFGRMSSEAKLRVRLGPGHKSEEGFFVIDSIAFERTYSVGEGNPAALDVQRYFELERHGPLQIYAWKGSLAAGRIDEIARERSAAVESVREILAVEPPQRIRLVFYPDSASKTSQTGHIGAGWASGTTIVEIYNDEIQLDPYHELAHVLTDEIGDVPAMFNEGFAVYVSERLQADALRHLGSPGSSVDAAACRFLAEGTAFSLAELSALEEIGSGPSRPTVAYPQAASVVKYLVETYGVERFRAIYRALAEEDGTAADRTAAVLERLLGMSTAEVGQRWRAAVESSCR